MTRLYPIKPCLNIYLLLSLALLGGLCACSKEENPIPSMPVYLKLDLSTTDRELKTIPSYKEYTGKDVNTALGERAGFAGVLVVHTLLNEYVAFDRACPFEANSNIIVVVDNEILNAVCPRCSTKYDLSLAPGAPNGQSRYYLKKYSVSQSSNFLTVKN